MVIRVSITTLATSVLITGAGLCAADNDPVSAQSDTFSERYKTFDQLDINHDGKLDVSELSTYGGNEPDMDASSRQRGERMMEKLDEDNNGAVSRQELQEGAEASATDSNWW